MIPARYGHILFGFLLSGMMSCIVAALSTFMTVGLVAELPDFWLRAWLTSWAVSFPTVLVVAPTARKLVGMLTR